jgi:hypothetical protein
MDSDGHTSTQVMQPMHSAASPLTVAIFVGSETVSGTATPAGLSMSDKMSTGQFWTQSPSPSHVSTLIETMYAISLFPPLDPCPARGQCCEQCI